MNLEKIKSSIRIVPDFPLKGIQFWDITTLLKNPEATEELLNVLYEEYKDKGITKVVALESRGFLFGPALALRLGVGFVPVRKPGKLPAATLSCTYNKEYGTDTVEIHRDAIEPGDVVLVHDDLIATGGSLKAAYNLVTELGATKVYINTLIELEALHGRDVFPEGVDVYTVLKA